MSNTNYTKGPWAVFDIHSSKACFDIAPEQKVSDFGACKSVFDETCIVFNSRDNAKDNAHLIAAAPELYEMLEFILSSSECDVFEMHTEIEGLLSKARGEI